MIANKEKQKEIIYVLREKVIFRNEFRIDIYHFTKNISPEEEIVRYFGAAGQVWDKKYPQWRKWCEVT